MNEFKVGQEGISLEGQRVTIIEVLANGLLVRSTTGAVFIVMPSEFEVVK